MAPSSCQPKGAKRIFLIFVLAIPIFYLVGGYFGVTTNLRGLPRAIPHIAVFDQKVSNWWTDYFSRLEAARPSLPPLRAESNGKAALELSAAERTILRHAHSAFVSRLAGFATELPFQSGTAGVVTTTSPSDFGQVVTLLLMLRQSGSSLPVEIVVETSSPEVERLCSVAIPPLHATCIFPKDLWPSLSQSVPRFGQAQCQALSILASSFEQVLFLTPDNLPVHNPDAVFSPDAQPFATTGLITWPDIRTSTVSPDFFHVAGDTDVSPRKTYPTLSRGALAIDKARHADTLLLAAYYNYYGPEYYYPLLAQDDVVGWEGSRETFLAAATVLEALATGPEPRYIPPDGWTKNITLKSLKKGHWEVKTPPRSYMRSQATDYSRSTTGPLMTVQMDPIEDYRAVIEAVKEDAYRRKHLDTDPSEEEEDFLASSSDTTSRARYGDFRDYITDSTFLSSIRVPANLTIAPKTERHMFFHHDGETKLDFTKTTEADSGGILAKDGNDMYLRLWGEPDWIITSTGRDVEKLLWEDEMAFWCRLQEYRSACRRMREVYDVVYARSYS